MQKIDILKRNVHLSTRVGERVSLPAVTNSARFYMYYFALTWSVPRNPFSIFIIVSSQSSILVFSPIDENIKTEQTFIFKSYHKRQPILYEQYFDNSIIFVVSCPHISHILVNLLLPPMQTKLREGNVFTPVYHSVDQWGGGLPLDPWGWGCLPLDGVRLPSSTQRDDHWSGALSIHNWKWHSCYFIPSSGD